MSSILDDARIEMVNAQEDLKRVEALDFSALEDALEHEQNAYERLMNALSREWRMVKALEGNPGQNKPKPKIRLKFTQKDRRYETERTADLEQEKMSEELAGYFKRMLELAQRQKAVTDQLAQLQLALEVAETFEEKEEIERQLKRLREEQRQLLAEIDQMLDQMDQSDKSEQLAETKQKLEKAREKAQEVSKAIQNKELAKASTESKRTEEEVKQSAEKLRESTASQFADVLEDMKAKVESLDEKQSELTEAISTQSHKGPAKKQLRDKHEKALRSQSEQLEELLDQMRETTTAAEDQEPLLSRKLYEAIREVETRGTTEAIDDAAKDIRRGSYAKASESESKAAENIHQLRKKLEAAAESVMGSETEALKQADRQLARIIEDLEKEMPPGKNEKQGKSGEKPGSGESEKEVASSESGKKGAKPGEGKSSGNGKGRDESGKTKMAESQSSGKGKGSGERNLSQGNPEDRQSVMVSGVTGESRGGVNHLNVPQGTPGFLDSFDDMTSERKETPLTGDDYKQWAEMLKDVETVLGQPELKRTAAKVRLRAREFRSDFKQHSKSPEWGLVDMRLLDPLKRLRNDVQEEIARKEGNDQQVRVDRDPVPEGFRELVAKYYEKLGSAN